MRILKSRIALLVLSGLASLMLAELFCEFYLPERSDTFVVNLLNYRQKYHHDLRLKETLHAPRAEAFRVMFLGDSFTWGPASPEDSFPHQVEEMFQKGSVPGVPKLDVQSFNLGMVSYSPSIYGVVLRDYAPELKPHLVVLAVDDSDLQDDLVYSPMVVRDGDGLPLSVYPAPPGVPRWLLPIAKRSKLVRLALAQLHRGRIQAERRSWDPLDRRLMTNRYSHYIPEHASAWEPEFSRSMALIDAIVRYCRRHEMQIAIVNYPYLPAVTRLHGREWRKLFGLDGDRIYDPVWHRVQRQYAESRQVPYYDFTNYLRRLNDHEGIYREGDGHFTVAGDRMLAEELVRFISTVRRPRSAAATRGRIPTTVATGPAGS